MKKVKIQELEFRFEDEESRDWNYKKVFHNGLPFTGICIEYDGSELKYVNGNAEGIYLEYHENGQKRHKYELKNGDFVGEEIIWNEEGIATEKRIHEKGKFKEMWWTNSGVLIYEKDEESGTIKEWYLTGEKKAIVIEGKSKLFSKQGNLIFETNNGNYKLINLKEEIKLIGYQENIINDILSSIGDEDIQRCFIKWLKESKLQEEEIIPVLERVLMTNDYFFVRDCIRVIKERKINGMKNIFQEILSKIERGDFLNTGDKELDNHNNKEIFKLITN